MNAQLQQALVSDGVIAEMVSVGKSEAIAFAGSVDTANNIVYAITCDCIEKFSPM